MTTAKSKIKRKSMNDAVDFLESMTGGPLTFGRLIYSIRMGDEISQVDFARKLGISKAYLCDIEKDRRSVSTARAWAWGKKLGYSPEQFLELALEVELRKNGLDYKVNLESA